MIVTEDGSGLPNAASFCSVADADAYHAARGSAAWAALTTEQKEFALVKACDYMQQAYRMRWAGYRVTTTQALDWPRNSVPRADSYGGNMGSIGNYYANNIVPTEVRNANAEFAMRSVAGDLAADIDAPVASEQVGPISVTYFQGDTKTKRYPAIDRLLMPFLSGGGNIKLVRA